jgi:hypothetical protein
VGRVRGWGSELDYDARSRLRLSPQGGSFSAVRATMAGLKSEDGDGLAGDPKSNILQREADKSTLT